MPPRGSAWLWLAVAAVAVTGLLVALSGRFPGALQDEETVMRLVYLSVLLALGGITIGFTIRRRPLAQLRNAAIWVGLGLILVIGYSFRDELGPRLLGELVPQRGVANADGSVTFHAGQDGHFHVDARVDGTLLRMLVDTGASEVVLSPADARRLGFDLDTLDFSRRSETANGPVGGAPVILREVQVGSVRVMQVSANVNGAEISESLLGMSFLSRLSGLEVSGDKLTLRP